VDDQTTNFVVIGAHDMFQTLMFTFAEDIEFELTLPDGSIFETIEQDYFSPLGPNQNVQISAFFEMTKITR
jgi:hypothetical protein